MTPADFDFDLPPERIALRPAAPRDAARLLAVRPGGLADHHVRDLPGLLQPGDLLVLNDTRVLAAQLSARAGTAKLGITLIEPAGDGDWWSFTKNARRVRVGDTIAFEGDEATASLIEKRPDGALRWRFDGPADALIARAGQMPLPPYIAAKRAADERDATDYQTIYAARPGAVAAPTAGLHFTPALFAALDAAGVRLATVTLHVGPGTFLPVKSARIEHHAIHAEWGEVSAAAADAVAATRARGGRVIAVGTTSLRLLESAVGEDGAVGPFAGDTALFITPGYTFRAVDGLLTNFHLPRSTLFMLVSALMGVETMRAAYAHAVADRYRFYSYGDASLLLPAGRS